MILLGARASRGVPCAPPCEWCGGDASAELLRGAALYGSPTLDPARPIERVGAWLSLSASTDALRVVVSGDALDSGMLSPTALRVRSQGLSESDPWRGAPLTGIIALGSRVLSARVVGLREERASLCVIELAGLCRTEGDGSLTLRFVVEGSGCLVCRIALRVGSLRAPRVYSVHGTSELPWRSQSAVIARFVDDALRLMQRCGHDPAELSLRAARLPRGTPTSRVYPGPLGLSDGVWRETLKLLARGRCAWVSLSDPRQPEGLGIEVSARLKGADTPLGLSAWMDASRMHPQGPSRWLDEAPALARELTGVSVGL